MKKQISESVYNELLGTPGITLEADCSYYLVTSGKTPTETPSGSRSPLAVIRVRKGHTLTSLSTKQAAAFTHVNKRLKGVGGISTISRVLSKHLAQDMQITEAMGSYYISALIEAEVLSVD
jgi:hypothetical protein